jgi:poly [ADP-ribose] polymerase
MFLFLLKTLAEVIENPNGDAAKEYNNYTEACERLSSAYYSIIPHDFGRNRPHSISSQALLKKVQPLSFRAHHPR